MILFFLPLGETLDKVLVKNGECYCGQPSHASYLLRYCIIKLFILQTLKITPCLTALVTTSYSRTSPSS